MKAAAYVSFALVVLALACREPAVAAPDSVAARGHREYATYCAPCHGSAGDGDGPLARMLAPRPARHSDAAYMSALSDEYLYRLLRDGGPAVDKSPLMGAWGRILPEQQIRDLVSYTRSLSAQRERHSVRLAR